MLSALGVDIIVDYKQSKDDLIADIVKKTGGKLYHIFDAVAQNLDFPAPFFKAIEGSASEKFFSSTNDWYNLTHPFVIFNNADDTVLTGTR
jgi:hypothetical protein